MKNSPSELPAAPVQTDSLPSFQRLRPVLFALIGVAVAFSLPLASLVSFALGNELFSFTLLVPFVSGYILWLQRSALPLAPGRTTGLAVICFACGAVALASYLALSGSRWVLQDRLSVQIFAFVCIFAGTCALFLRPVTLRAVAFPLGFLLFMVPFPVAMVDAIEHFFQHTSAATAAVFFKLAGTPFFREQTFFQLPGINLEVAPECSGIRSSLALFITSLVAGQLFLRSRTKRLILAFAVIPLGIVRNGVRIFTIGELCVHVSPAMIDSWIHHHGGPFFFALSLVPFSLLLWYLVRSDRATLRTTPGRQSRAVPSTIEQGTI